MVVCERAYRKVVLYDGKKTQFTNNSMQKVTIKKYSSVK